MAEEKNEKSAGKPSHVKAEVVRRGYQPMQDGYQPKREGYTPEGDGQGESLPKPPPGGTGESTGNEGSGKKK